MRAPRGILRRDNPFDYRRNRLGGPINHHVSENMIKRDVLSLDKHNRN